MRSDFLGASLRTAQAGAKTSPGKFQIQALFGSGPKKAQKKAQKETKGGTQKFGGIVKQAQKAVNQVINRCTFLNFRVKVCACIHYFCLCLQLICF